jgi:hypothetical protein
MDDLAKAQECLDQVQEADPTTADNCLQYVAKYDSQQANILKCSIYMTSGGLMENKVVQAIEALDDAAVQNKEAAYMSILSLDKPSIPAGYTKAVEGNAFCQASGVPGLQYIGGLVVAGSYMANTMNTLGITLDINNPDAAVQNLINQCTSATPPAACSSDAATLGETVSTLADSYCGSSSADNDVCNDINAAVTAAGADSADIGRAIFCYLETPSKQYDPATDLCF